MDSLSPSIQVTYYNIQPETDPEPTRYWHRLYYTIYSPIHMLYHPNYNLPAPIPDSQTLSLSSSKQWKQYGLIATFICCHNNSFFSDTLIPFPPPKAHSNSSLNPKSTHWGAPSWRRAEWWRWEPQVCASRVYPQQLLQHVNTTAGSKLISRAATTCTD